MNLDFSYVNWRYILYIYSISQPLLLYSTTFSLRVTGEKPEPF